MAKIKIKASVRYSTAMRINASEIKKVFRDIVVDEAKKIKPLYTKIQSNFSHKNRVRIYTTTGRSSSSVQTLPGWSISGVIFSAVGTNKPSPLLWLGAGTKVRYRVMSPNWFSMTKPGGGMSFGPRTGVAKGWGKKPGIQPRNFRDHIIEKRSKQFGQNANRRFAVMMRRMKWI